MKLKVIKEYTDVEYNVSFAVDDILKIKDSDIVPTSEFYHIWNGNKLLLIPKQYCEIIK